MDEIKIALTALAEAVMLDAESRLGVEPVPVPIEFLWPHIAGALPRIRTHYRALPESARTWLEQTAERLVDDAADADADPARASRTLETLSYVVVPLLLNYLRPDAE